MSISQKPSWAVSRMRRILRSLAASASSAFMRSVTSCLTATKCVIAPSRERTGVIVISS